MQLFVIEFQRLLETKAFLVNHCHIARVNYHIAASAIKPRSKLFTRIDSESRTFNANEPRVVRRRMLENTKTDLRGT